MSQPIPVCIASTLSRRTSLSSTFSPSLPNSGEVINSRYGKTTFINIYNEDAITYFCILNFEFAKNILNNGCLHSLKVAKRKIYFQEICFNTFRFRLFTAEVRIINEKRGRCFDFFFIYLSVKKSEILHCVKLLKNM